MNAIPSAHPQRGLNWALILVLAVLAVAIFWFVGNRIHFWTDISEPSLTPYFWPKRGAFIPHVFGGLVAISAGLIQIWLGLTKRTAALHRALGRVYVAGVVIGSAGGFYLAGTITEGLVYAAGLFMLCVAWVLTTGMAIWSAKTRRMQQHRDWMLRSYIVTFAFVVYRLGENVLVALLDVPRGDPLRGEIGTLMAWACWAVPLLLAEPLIQLRHLRSSR